MQRYKNLQKQEINSNHSSYSIYSIYSIYSFYSFYSTYSIHSIMVTTKKQEAPPSIMTVKPRV